MRTLPALALLAACAADPAVDGWTGHDLDTAPAALPAAHAAPPIALELTDVLPGQPFTLAAHGVTPGETVFFIYSLHGTTCAGCGPVLPGLGGLTASLAGPIRLFPGGSAVADASGVARYTFAVPAGARAGMTLGVQAAVPSGRGGSASYASAAHLVTVGLRRCADDVLESNDLPDLAASSADQHTPGLRACPGDDDWFRIDAQADDMLRTSVTYAAAGGNVDVFVYASDGVTLIDSGTSGGDVESVHTIVPATGTYYIRVALQGEADRTPGNDYTLDINQYREPAVYADGTFAVSGTYSGDLDAGKQVGQADRSQADFWWEQLTSTTRQLVPQGGARFQVWGPAEPHYGWCLESAAYWLATDDPIDGSNPGFGELSPGTWLCGITADAHVFKARVDAIDRANTLTLTHTTWDSPFAWRVVDDGLVTIPGTWLFDVDTGAVTADATGDMWWRQMTSTTRQMEPRHGGLLAPTAGLDIAGPTACEGYTLSTTPISGDDLSFGPLSPFRNACVRSNLGATAAINVVGVDATQNNGLIIGFTRWAFGPPPAFVRSFRVRGTWLADLDVGAEVAGVPEADLWWEQMTSTTRQLVPRNGAQLARMGATEPDYADCAWAHYSADPIDGSGATYGQLPVGTWLCAVTNGGAVAKVQITHIDPASNHTLSLTETRW